jgi:hypothetical protein
MTMLAMDERKRFSYMVAVGITPVSDTYHNPDVGLQDDSIPMYLVWDDGSDGSDVQPHTQFPTVMNPLGCWSDSKNQTGDQQMNLILSCYILSVLPCLPRFSSSAPGSGSGVWSCYLFCIFRWLTACKGAHHSTEPW